MSIPRQSGLTASAESRTEASGAVRGDRPTHMLWTDADFLQALLHDLKGPVGRVRMLGELVRRRSPDRDAESQVLLGHLEDSAATAEKVLDGLRRYAEAAALPFDPRPFDLTTALRDALSRLEARLAASGARVSHGPLPEVRGDIGQMRRLFEELIVNAIQFRSAEAPAIEIGATSEAGYWQISVVDNGIGLTGTDPQRIFRPFAKSPDGSAGMGLAICCRIAGVHGGELIAVPRPRGLEVRLYLPQLT